MSTEKGSRLLQYVAASTGNLNIMACGAILGWTSPMLPRLQEHDPIAGDNQLGRAISKDEGSWLAALVPLGVTVGSIFAGYLGEWLGRKRSLLIGTLPFLVGWILVGTARHIEQMYAGRFILGLSVAIPFTFLPTYVGEISEAAVRGALGSLLQIFVSMGFIYSYVIGPYTSYTTLWLLCASLHIVFFLGFLFMPESPYYLLSKGQVDDACKTLARFRGKSVEAVQKEIEEIQSELNEAPQENSSSWKDVLLVPVNRKAVILTSILMSFQEFIGIDVVLAYVENIFRDAGTKDTALSAIVVGVVQLLASSIAPLFVDKYGRKILLVISSIGCCLTIGLLGAYFYLKKIDYPLDNMGWVPLATLVFYIITYSIGWGPMPWMIMGEMFASSVKSKASSICVFSIWGFSFLLTKIFVDIQEERGPHMGFWFFSVCAALSIIFVTMFFPETRCKTLAEIQQQLSRGVHQKEEKSKKKNSLNNRQIEVAVISPVLDTDKAQGPV